MKGDESCIYCQGTGMITDKRYTFAGRPCMSGQTTGQLFAVEEEIHRGQIRLLEKLLGWAKIVAMDYLDDVTDTDKELFRECEDAIRNGKEAGL